MEQKKTGETSEKLRLWQDRYRKDLVKYQGHLDRMDRREKLYRGDNAIEKTDGTRARQGTPHVRNIVQEIVETQVDSNIPQPKVTAVLEEDEPLAKIIEDMLRNELDRLPMEELNDLSERTVPIQGGEGILPEWDVTLGTHTSIGEIRLTQLHPKKIVPQDGVYRVEDMDWYFITADKTKGYVKRRYGVDLDDQGEEQPDIRAVDGDAPADEVVTVIFAFYRNKNGGIGRYVWSNNTELEDLEDSQARRLQICTRCGAVGDGVKCRECGATSFREESEEYETLTDDVLRTDGTVIPAVSPARDEYGQPVYQDVGETEMVQPMPEPDLLLQKPGGGTPFGVVDIPQEPVLEPTKIPYYKPDRYPLIIRKNVSLYGEFLGSSDVDAIEYQQNTTNKLSAKINKKILGGGSIFAKPAELKLEYSDQDFQVANVSDVAQMQRMQVFNLQVDVSADRAYKADVYEEARQQIGITDSMQGRKDPTATSGVAKQFSAAKAAGRLESKRVMKQMFYSDLFRMMFQLMLAYAEEPREVVSYNDKGEKEYKRFNRWDFLKQDDAGQWYWNDRFLFSCDSSAPLAGDREKLWQENRMNLQQGAYGPPQELQSLILFWEIMEREHYPMASVVKKNLQEMLEQQREAQAQQAALQAALAGGMSTGQTAEQNPAEPIPAADQTGGIAV